MQFNTQISSILKTKVPNIRLGVFEIALSAPIGDLHPLVDQPVGEIRTFVNQLKAQYDLEAITRDQISQISAIQHGRKAYRALGKDPTKYRLSAEKLLRRFLGEEGFPYYNRLGAPLVDVSNLVSLNFKSPVGTVDLNKLAGNAITIDVGKPMETYMGLSGTSLNLEGLIVSRDATGPFGSTTADSMRSGITETTQFIQMIVFLLDPEIDLDAVAAYVLTLIKAVDLNASTEYTFIS